jgi:Fe-S cluster biogenesis protein NfuA
MNREVGGMAEPVHNHKTGVTEEEKLHELIEALSAYIEQYHGGWVRWVGLEGDTLQVELGGACEGCALSTATLHGWIGGTVRQFFPEITKVVAV